MEVKSKLKPGENGTKALAKEYGDQLLCVRYRYDKTRHKRYKTVELIVDEKDWVPNVIYPKNKLVDIRISFGEKELREQIKSAGAFWNVKKKLWRLPYLRALQMGLEHRIVREDFDF
ncbi:hypothetical protein ACFL17_05885 [Pseudomonadota bacterium]